MLGFVCCHLPKNWSNFGNPFCPLGSSCWDPQNNHLYLTGLKFLESLFATDWIKFLVKVMDKYIKEVVDSCLDIFLGASRRSYEELSIELLDQIPKLKIKKSDWFDKQTNRCWEMLASQVVLQKYARKSSMLFLKLTDYKDLPN